MNLSNWQMAVVRRYWRMVLQAGLKAGLTWAQAHTDAALAVERAEARFKAKNWAELQRHLNETMLGAVRWS